MVRTGKATISYLDEDGDEIDFVCIKKYILIEDKTKTKIPIGCRFVNIEIKLYDVENDDEESSSISSNSDN
jgi:hypothetical protein